MNYGYGIQWTNKELAVTKLELSGYSSPEEAKKETVNLAKKMGWPGNRKWYEFWRIHDTVVEGEE